jgi:hypothetical protein
MDFRIKVGLFFVVTHFIILAWVLICKFMGGYTFEEMTTLIALLIPMFASYSTVIIKDIVKNAEVDQTNKVVYTAQFKFLTLFLCILFFGFLFTVIFLKAFNYGFEDFEQLKLTVGILESMFGAYVGQFIFSMYKAPNKH